MNDNITVKPSILTREYNAPRQLVFEAWTQSNHLKNWMFPFEGFTCEYISADIKSGGSSLHKMITPDGFEMWLLTKYEEVIPPGNLIFRQYMSNEKSEILSNPQMPDWPKEMRATITFEEEGDKTKIVLIWEPIDPTKKEADIFATSLIEHGNGWEGGLDQLTKYLAAL